MPFGLRCFQYMLTNILGDEHYMFGVKNLFMVEKVLLLRNDLVSCCLDHR